MVVNCFLADYSTIKSGALNAHTLVGFSIENGVQP